MAVFLPLLFDPFSVWVKSTEFRHLRIAKIERWKFLSSLALWHEFLVLELVPLSNHQTVSPPPLGSTRATTLSPGMFEDMAREGLIVRFDRRLKGDFATFVSREDKRKIASECYVVSTTIHRPGGNLHFPAPPSPTALVGPHLNDAIFIVQLFRDTAPTYHLLKRNCWSHAASALLLLNETFRGDLIMSTPSRSETSLSVKQKFKATLGKHFGAITHGDEALQNESFGMALHRLYQATVTGASILPPGSEAAGEYNVLKAIGSARLGLGADARERLLLKYHMHELESLGTIPLNDHPFRGYLRAQACSDQLLAESESNASHLLHGLQAVIARPEWRDQVLADGPHEDFAKHIGPLFISRTAARDASLVMEVLLPFLTVFQPCEDASSLAQCAGMVYNHVFRHSTIIADLISALYIAQPEWSDTPVSHHIRGSILLILKALATHPGILPILCANGLPAAIVELLEYKNSASSDVEEALNLVGCFVVGASEASSSDSTQHVITSALLSFWEVVLTLLNPSSPSILTQACAARSISLMATSSGLHSMTDSAISPLGLLLASATDAQVINHVVGALIIIVISGSNTNDSGFDVDRLESCAHAQVANSIIPLLSLSLEAPTMEQLAMVLYGLSTGNATTRQVLCVSLETQDGAALLHRVSNPESESARVPILSPATVQYLNGMRRGVEEYWSRAGPAPIM